MSERAQAHTLEAITAAILLLSSVVFALQVTAVTPLTGSTSSQHIENQQAAMADGLLDAAVENGSLTETLLLWNESAGRFADTDGDGYENGGPPTRFGATLNRTFLDRGIAVNVRLLYLQPGDASRERVEMVYLGYPSAHASVATRTVTLYDDQRLRRTNGSLGPSLENASFYARDIDPGSRLYNVVRVEVTLWRM